MSCNRPIRNSGNIYGVLLYTHIHSRTRVSHSGEIFQEQRCIPEAGSDIDWTWKLSRAECISRATSTHINKQPHSTHTHTHTEKGSNAHSHCLNIKQRRGAKHSSHTYNLQLILDAAALL